MSRRNPANELAVLQRRKTVADLTLHEVPQYEIAKRLGVDVRTVRRDQKALRAEWQARMRADTDLERGRALAKLDLVECHAREGWHRSCEDAVTVFRRVLTGRKTKEGKPLPDLVTETRVVRSQAGDPRFLAEYRKAVLEQCRIRGILQDRDEGIAERTGPIPIVAIHVVEPGALPPPRDADGGPYRNPIQIVPLE